MIRIVASIDEKDPKLGHFFSECGQRLQTLLADSNLLNGHFQINSQRCNSAYIEIALPQKVENKPFIFIAYTHGNENALISQGSQYVYGDNVHVFNGSLMYSMACLTGKTLGGLLIESGCRTFIGYTEPSMAFLEKGYKEITINCELSGLNCFFNSALTIKECFDKMKSYYAFQIDQLSLCADVLARANLVANNEALILLGDPNVKASDFDID